MTAKNINLTNGMIIGNNQPLMLIAGPCTLESRDHALEMSQAIGEIAARLNIPYIYKTSFDKANRSSIASHRGVGMDKGLEILAEVKEKRQCLLLTDVHLPDQCAPVGEVVDVLQIPAYLCRQTDLLIAAAQTGRVINVKKGQFLAPWDMKHVAAKIADSGNDNIMLCERGASFGYNRLVSDMRAIPIMRDTGYPVIFDATHSVQEPGGAGATSGGQREYVATLARAAVAIGVAGVFLETHQDPDKAPSDGPNMVPLHKLEELVANLQEFDKIAKKTQALSTLTH